MEYAGVFNGMKTDEVRTSKQTRKVAATFQTGGEDVSFTEANNFFTKYSAYSDNKCIK